MALLRRLSNSVWAFLSPQKAGSRNTYSDFAGEAQSPSVNATRKRLRTWDTNSSSDFETDTGVHGRKRQLLHFSSTSTKRRLTGTPGDSTELDESGSTNVEGDEGDESFRNFDHIAASPDSDGLSANLDDSLVVEGDEYEREALSRKKVVNLPEEIAARGVSTEELRSAGWGEEHIELVQKLAMRGYEPLLPLYYKWDYRFLPDGLFSDDDEAFISSVKASHYRSIKALEKLFEVGGRVRDRLQLGTRACPEKQVLRHLKEYIKWANEDSGLDASSSIPLLTIVAQPGSIPAAELQEQAREDMAKLAKRYEEAFGARASIESSPASDLTNLSYPIPQLYAVIASSTVVALVAYRPQLEQNIRPVIFFDFRDKNYDVWNALALSIIVNHCRNVQLQIAKDTGLGESGSVYATNHFRDGRDVDDPDL